MKFIAVTCILCVLTKFININLFFNRYRLILDAIVANANTVGPDIVDALKIFIEASKYYFSYC